MLIANLPTADSVIIGIINARWVGREINFNDDSFLQTRASCFGINIVNIGGSSEDVTEKINNWYCAYHHRPLAAERRVW